MEDSKKETGELMAFNFNSIYDNTNHFLDQIKSILNLIQYDGPDNVQNVLSGVITIVEAFREYFEKETDCYDQIKKELLEKEVLPPE